MTQKEWMMELMVSAAEPITEKDIIYWLKTSYPPSEFNRFTARYIAQGPKSVKPAELKFLRIVMKVNTAISKTKYDKDMLNFGIEELEHFLKAYNQSGGASAKLVALEKQYVKLLKEYPIAKVKKLMPFEKLKTIPVYIDM